MAAGEPVDRGNDLFGSTVTLASRICDAADGGQTLVSNVVRDVGAPLGYGFNDAGPRILKGFGAPSLVFELQRAHAG
jgi:class 3 adenylate cyclase